MTISSVNTWGVGVKLTSAQINAVDLNATYAVDKRSGQTDTIQSIVSCSGAGRIVPSYAAGANADTTYALSSGISVINASTGLTAARAYTLSNTAAVSGDKVLVLGGTTYDVTVKNAASTTLLIVGTSTTAQSAWGEFIFNGTAWILLRSSPDIRGFAPTTTRATFRPDVWDRDGTMTAASVMSQSETLDQWDGTYHASSTRYVMRMNGMNFGEVNTGSTAGYGYRMRLGRELLTQGRTLSTATLRLQPAAGHSSLPEQMPALIVYRADASLTYASLASTSQVDTSPDIGSYETSHVVTYTANQNNVIDHASYTYMLAFVNEGGASALANGEAWDLIFTFT